MKIQEFENCLVSNLKEYNIVLKETQICQFYNYMNLLIEWNKKVNLTAIVEPKEIIIKHFVDSLTIYNEIKENSIILDIGTGAGFPGIPLKIVKPNIKITLLDSLKKRITFLEELIKQLELVNIETIHGRAEDNGRNPQYREQYDIVVSRAVADLRILSEYMLPFAKVGGKCISLKGPNVRKEIQSIREIVTTLGGSRLNVRNIDLIGGEIKRNIVIIEKISHTPSKFPRRQDKIEKNK